VVCAWPEPPSAMPAGPSADVHDGTKAFALGTTDGLTLRLIRLGCRPVGNCHEGRIAAFDACFPAKHWLRAFSVRVVQNARVLRLRISYSLHQSGRWGRSMTGSDSSSITVPSTSITSAFTTVLRGGSSNRASRGKPSFLISARISATVRNLRGSLLVALIWKGMVLFAPAIKDCG